MQIEPVPLRTFQRLLHGGLFGQELAMKRPGMDGKGHSSRRILDESARFAGGRGRAHLYVLSGVRDARSGPEHDRDIEFLGELKGKNGHLLCLPGIRGVKAGYAGKLGITARVLLILRGMAKGIIGTDHHQSRAHTQIGQGHEGICGHIQTHVLHGGRGATAGPGGSGSHLQSNFLVHGPFYMRRPLTLEFDQRFYDLRGGCAGIAGDKPHSCLQEASGNCCVSEKIFSHK